MKGRVTDTGEFDLLAAVRNLRRAFDPDAKIAPRGPMRFEPPGSGRPWSEREDRLVLSIKWGALGERGELARIAVELGRSTKAVYQRRQVLRMRAGRQD